MARIARIGRAKNITGYQVRVYYMIIRYTTVLNPDCFQFPYPTFDDPPPA
jgi:hypothetical protein